jgi:hypothetical protein
MIASMAAQSASAPAPAAVRSECAFEEERERVIEHRE